jgi:tRNA (mo5U34)-methyltransferase
VEESKSDILRKLDSVTWYHSFEIVPGVFTPGRLPTDAKATFAHFGLPADLSGKAVLEIGTWDGPVAFECEARGALVTALDIQDPDKTGFNVAKEILGSKVTYVQGSVYDTSRLLHDRYDYVFMLGVYYHLKNPILAFEQVAQLLVDDGLLVFEGACIQAYCEDVSGRPVSAERAREIGESDVPLCAFYANTFCGDDSNWFIPNFVCLEGWMEAAGLRIVRHALHIAPSDPRIERVGGVAQKVGRLRVEHRLVE